MRQFIVLGHEAPTTPEFSLDDLPGGAGRLDVLCRCVSAAFFLSHAIRSDVRTYLVMQDEYTIRFEGSELRRLNPDERSTAALLRRALEAGSDAIGHREVESTPGVYISKRGFEPILEDASRSGRIYQLHEKGTPVVDVPVPADPVFVLSDHRDFTPADRRRIESYSSERICLGPRALHANHAITVAHNWLDTDGFTRHG